MGMASERETCGFATGSGSVSAVVVTSASMRERAIFIGSGHQPSRLNVLTITVHRWQASPGGNLGRNLYALEYSRSALGAYALIGAQVGHGPSILVARGRDSARCARGEPQHAGVARQDLRDKSAHAAAHRVLLETRLQSSSKTRSLKPRRYHKGHLSEIG